MIATIIINSIKGKILEKKVILHDDLGYPTYINTINNILCLDYNYTKFSLFFDKRELKSTEKLIDLIDLTNSTDNIKLIFDIIFYPKISSDKLSKHTLLGMTHDNFLLELNNYKITLTLSQEIINNCKKIIDIYTNKFNFAILYENRDLFIYDSYNFDNVLCKFKNITKTVINYGAIAALNTANILNTYGLEHYGGEHTFTDIKDIYASKTMFIIIKTNNYTMSIGQIERILRDEFIHIYDLTNVKMIYSNEKAFAALKYDNTVSTWGNLIDGGDSSKVSSQLVDIYEIYHTFCAFAALTKNGTVITWGEPLSGGCSDKIKNKLYDIEYIVSIRHTFCALRKDKQIIIWGYGDSDMFDTITEKFIEIKTSGNSFCGLTNSGNIIVWYEFKVYKNLIKNVSSIYCNFTSFLVVHNNDKIIIYNEKYFEDIDKNQNIDISIDFNDILAIHTFSSKFIIYTKNKEIMIVDYYFNINIYTDIIRMFEIW